MTNVLIVEDDKEFAQRCAASLFKQNYQVLFSENELKAKSVLLSEPVDIVLIDLMLAPTYSLEGLNFLRFLKHHYPHIEPFMMTTKDRDVTEIVSEAMTLGARHFFDKNSTLFEEKLEYSIRELLAEKRQGIFISHGHDELLKLKLKDFILNRLGRHPVILAEQPNQGLTIVEKLERVSQRCKFALILMTKDDEVADGGLRARQNVIHEIGFFQGKYGRNNVVLLAERGIELFSNISGIVRIEFEPHHFEAIFEPLRIEIESAFRAEL